MLNRLLLAKLILPIILFAANLISRKLIHCVKVLLKVLVFDTFNHPIAYRNRAIINSGNNYFYNNNDNKKFKKLIISTLGFISFS